MPRYGRRRRFRRRPTEFRLRRIFKRRNPKKKYNPGKWRRHLLNSSFSATHYRSLWTITTTFLAPAGNVNANYIRVNALPDPSVQPFWTTPAAKAVDTGNPVPGFGRNVVIRGGRIFIILSLRPLLGTVVDAVKVRVFLIWRKACSDNATLPTSGTESWTWDPSVLADFVRFGKIVWSKQAILETQQGSASVQMFHTLRPQKIDTEIFEGQGAQFVWVVMANKLSNTALLNSSVDVQVGHSLSFSGDEIS